MSIVFCVIFYEILSKGGKDMIYERIKELCKINGISVNFLEKELGIARGSLCKIDKHNPTSEKLQAIANYLKVDTDYLLNGKDANFNKEMAIIDVKLSEMSKELKDYSLKLNSLTKDKQMHVMSLIDMLLNS
jgi:transcriptional regulator with XRE-family HTH domain